MMKNKLIKLLLSMIILTSGTAFAYDYTCKPAGGVPKAWSFTMNYNLTTPSDNTAGRVIPNAFTWSGASSSSTTCDCPAPAVGVRTMYFKSDTSLPVSHTDGKLTYYRLSDYLEVATTAQSYTAAGMVPLPWSNGQFTTTGNYNLCAGGSNGMATGNSGNLTLYFTKPFVGVQTIPNTVLHNLYSTISSGGSVYGTVPYAIISLQGTVTVPQSCNINAGQVINVDFGNVMANDMKTKGATANGFTPKVVNMTLACNNISEGIKVSLSINGQASTGDVTALKTTNNDIGVRILDSTGTVVSPNNGRLPVTMSYSAQTGTSTMSLAPMNVTGNTPTVGQFNAIATVNAEMQ